MWLTSKSSFLACLMRIFIIFIKKKNLKFLLKRHLNKRMSALFHSKACLQDAGCVILLVLFQSEIKQGP